MSLKSILVFLKFITVLLLTRSFGSYLLCLKVHLFLFILSDIPPSPTNLMLDDDQTSNNQIGILWDYPDPSQLCGFGSNVQHAIHFVIEYYKSNHCLFLEKVSILNMMNDTARVTLVLQQTAVDGMSINLKSSKECSEA